MCCITTTHTLCHFFFSFPLFISLSLSSYINMPGGLERQNAFSEYCGSKTFTEVRVFIISSIRLMLMMIHQLQCHICKQYESDGDWIKIQCKCNTPPLYVFTRREVQYLGLTHSILYSAEYVYSHKHCFTMSGKCKQCRRAYTLQNTAAAAVPTTTPLPHYNHIILGRSSAHTHTLEHDSLSSKNSIATC